MEWGTFWAFIKEISSVLKINSLLIIIKFKTKREDINYTDTELTKLVIESSSSTEMKDILTESYQEKEFNGVKSILLSINSI